MGYDLNKERDEAIRAGEVALSCLRDAYNELDKARTWGVIDIIGGSFLSSFLKRRRMQDAEDALDRADGALERFTKELSDVGRFANINVNTNDILGLADLFYENFLVDILMQNRIKTALSQINDAIQKVEYAINQLKRL